MFYPYARAYWYRPYYYGGWGYGGLVGGAVAHKTDVTNNLTVNANATGGSTVSVNVNQQTTVNNTSTAAGGYFPYYRRWW